jgi:N-acetylglutamate synthase-like GNAT family acetyltransferase
VTGCITFDENKAELSDLAIRPSVRNGTVGKDLIQAVKDYAIKTSKTELVARTSEENRHWFEGHEFVSVDSDDDVCVYKLCLAKL